ncbi:MAG: hypothetical protein SGJ02_07745 [bacterium]|nr:hypothetical protein [bacterium]
MKKTLIIALLSFIVSGCAPRGETKTIEQLLSIAQDRMARAEVHHTSQVPQDVSTLKVSLEKALSLTDTASITKVMSEIGNTIGVLIPHAGMTSRASLNELSNQYKELAKVGNPTSDQVKLLVARTLHTVASELETTQFSL